MKNTAAASRVPALVVLDRRRPSAALAAVVLTSLVGGCGALGSSAPPSESPGTRSAYTLTNLHPDDARSKLSTVNYQQAGLIPMCTKVTMEPTKRKSMTFRVDSTGRQYTYFRHKSLQGSFEQHLALFFGPRCDQAKMQALGKKDQEGIRNGRAYPGMTKVGVIYAMGYPPQHATASTDLDEWRYWSNRFNTMIVHFKDDRVTGIQE